MKKIIYIEENFISLDECKKLVNHADMTAGGHQENTTPPSEPQEDNYDYASHHARQDKLLDSAQYQGHADFIDMKDETDDLYTNVVKRVTRICKLFDDRANPDYVGVIRWEPGTFMKPHYDDSAKEGIYDLFAALLYLNDDFEGGYTGFKDMEVKPKAGKLLIFSNSQYKHHVTKVIGKHRYALSFWFNTSST